jgi:hypothetical protein
MKRHLVLLCVLLLGLPRLLWAGYQFHTLDIGFPGASATVVTGLTLRGLVVGLYQDAHHLDQGFLQTRGGRTTMLLNVTPQAIAGEVVVGWYQTVAGQTHGFVLRAGTFAPIQGPFVAGKGFAPVIEPLDVNAAGLVVGTFRSQVDAQVHGFLYDSTTGAWLQVDVPGATATTLAGINALGQQVGSFLDAGGQRHLFRRTGTTVEDVTIPGLADADLVGLTDNGRLAGNAGASGFVVAAGTVELIAVPDAPLTQLFGIREDGAVYGRYLDGDGVAHGFVAVPEGSQLSLEPGPRPLLRAFELIECLPGSQRPACQ